MSLCECTAAWLTCSHVYLCKPHVRPDSLCAWPCHCRLRLSSTCTGLRQASLAWFPKLAVTWKHGKPFEASLAAWLERRQGEQLLPAAAGCDVHNLHAGRVVCWDTDTCCLPDPYGWCCSLQPPSLVWPLRGGLLIPFACLTSSDHCLSCDS